MDSGPMPPEKIFTAESEEEDYELSKDKEGNVLFTTTSIVPPDERDRIEAELRNRLGEFASSDASHQSHISFLLERALETPLEQGIEILKKTVEYYGDDYNFPSETMDSIKQLLLGLAENSSLSALQYDASVRVEATLVDSFSPYPEVRSVCDPYDDPSIPVETVRAYFLGLVWVVIGTFVNSFFAWRQPSLSLRSAAIQLLMYPCGKAMQLLPDWSITIRGRRIRLNPGPWSFKEQMFASIMVNSSSGSSNFMNYVLSQRLPVFYNEPWVKAGYICVVNLSSMVIGYSWAGMLRRWVIYPSRAIWPTILPTLALNRALLVPEAENRVNGWKISRYRFFFICFIGMFLYFFLPDYLFTALSTFNWMTWIAPQNLKLAIISGSILGLGVNPLPSFDWAVINYFNPLVVPVFSTVNNYIGMVFGGVTLVAMYWTNYRWTAYMPINSNELYSSAGETFNVSRVLTNGVLDLEKYRAYSPPYLSAGYLVYLGGFLAMYPMTLLYVLMTEWRAVRGAFMGYINSFRKKNSSAYTVYDDPMSRMMMRYKEVPDWWYFALFVVSFVVFMLGVTQYPTNTPAWTVVISGLMSFVMVIPIVMIYSMTGFLLRMNNIASVIAGYMAPGNGNANLLCRLIGINLDNEADSFISDLKLAHYSKIPPRAAFRCQLIATVVQCFVGVGVILFQIDSIDNLCSPTQKDKFTCPGTRTIWADSVIFGVIGPERIFNHVYPKLKYSFLIGAAVVPVFVYARKYFPKYMQHVHPVLLANGASTWGQTYNLTYFTPGLYMSLIFMWFIKERYLPWWSKYNYVLTAAFSSAIALSGVVIYFAFQYKSVKLIWWGNTVSKAGLDGAKDATLLPVPEGGFGLPAGQF